MQRSTKQILAAFVTGRLAKMGAPPQSREKDASAPVSTPRTPTESMTGTLVKDGSRYSVKVEKTGARTELQLPVRVKAGVLKRMKTQGRLTGKPAQMSRTAGGTGPGLSAAGILGAEDEQPASRT